MRPSPEVVEGDSSLSDKPRETAEEESPLSDKPVELKDKQIFDPVRQETTTSNVNLDGNATTNTPLGLLVPSRNTTQVCKETASPANVWHVFDVSVFDDQ